MQFSSVVKSFRIFFYFGFSFSFVADPRNVFHTSVGSWFYSTLLAPRSFALVSPSDPFPSAQRDRNVSTRSKVQGVWDCLLPTMDVPTPHIC